MGKRKQCISNAIICNGVDFHSCCVMLYSNQGYVKDITFSKQSIKVYLLRGMIPQDSFCFCLTDYKSGCISFPKFSNLFLPLSCLLACLLFFSFLLHIIHDSYIFKVLFVKEIFASLTHYDLYANMFSFVIDFYFANGIYHLNGDLVRKNIEKYVKYTLASYSMLGCCVSFPDIYK